MSENDMKDASIMPDSASDRDARKNPPPQKTIKRLPSVPASFFAMVLGLAGLGNDRRATNLTIGLIAVKTIQLLLQGRLLPVPK